MLRRKTTNMGDDFVTADAWFVSGRRVLYDTMSKRIIDRKNDKSTTLSVFEKVVKETPIHSNSRWLTLLPGFPDGSYGYSKVDSLLQGTHPRLYIEYVGQGDSDTPSKNYVYSTVERADLVQAQWRAHSVRRTVVVTFDYSSLVLLELLRRQEEGTLATKIEHVLIINGGLFADGHSHPWSTTPLLQTSLGKMGARWAQSSNFMLNTMMKPLFSKAYWVSMPKQELRELQVAIRRHKGTRFLSQAAGFVEEHQRQAKCWDLYDIYARGCQNTGLTMHIVGSTQDPFEYKQIGLAKERMKNFYPNVKVDTIPGGHYSTLEQAPALATFIHDLLRKSTARPQQPRWASTVVSTKTGTAAPPSVSAKAPLPFWASSPRSVTEDYQ